MTDRFEIAIVGSGPAGLSAAARAAECRVAHVLLEGSPHLAQTIYRYQKGKYVMDEPASLPLRASLPFRAGSREQVLATWAEAIRRLGVNLRLNAEVTAIVREGQAFCLTIGGRDQITARTVVLAIGLQGNIRKLGVPGQDLPCVQYQLDDPEEYQDETIVVVGAGDAAIENALALAARNQVIIVNRRDEFSRAKERNLKAILKAIEEGRIECYYRTQPERVEMLPAGRRRARIVLATPEGEAQILCHRVIARLGALPPRHFVERCGVSFPSSDPAAVPIISPRYESNVPGLYIIGALAGYPLIKQAINQGYEVVETILGRSIEPADTPLLRRKLQILPGFANVDGAIEWIRARAPVVSALSPLQLREMLLEAELHAPSAGSVIFRRNDYTNSFYCILAGYVEVETAEGQRFRLREREFFGEMSLISGRRRNATVRAGNDCVLLEIPRRTVLRIMQSVTAVREMIDRAFVKRAIQTKLAPEATPEQVEELAREASLVRYRAGDVLFAEGEIGDCLHLVRSGSLMVSRTIAGREVVLSYVAAGNYVGEMALLGESRRTATVRAAIATETIRVDGKSFKRVVERNPVLRMRLQAEMRQRTAQNVAMQVDPRGGDLISFLIAQGAGEATDILLIDESLCIRCDNCEKACAETHGGTSRLDREAGPTFAEVHVPTSCRHCEHPHCMKDCPPDAIHRAPNGEVYIADNCIGCGNCVENCPYGVIHLAGPVARKPGLLSWLLFGLGPGPGEAPKQENAHGEKKAVKCDMCRDLAGGPACVRSCPTGAAIRISPEEFPNYARARR